MQPSWYEDLALAIGIALLSILFPLGGYWTFFETVMHGQTPAKRMLGIRVIQRTGAPAHFTQLVIRNLFRLIECFFPFQYAIGAFSLIFSRNTQRLGDQATGLIVVKERKQEKAKPFQWKANAGRFVIDHEKKVELAHEEFDMLIEYMRISPTLRPEDRHRIAIRLARAVIVRAGLDRDPEWQPLIAAMKATMGDLRQGTNAAEHILHSLMNLYLQRND
jgi:hypothetical protein